MDSRPARNMDRNYHANVIINPIPGLCRIQIASHVAVHEFNGDRGWGCSWICAGSYGSESLKSTSTPTGHGTTIRARPHESHEPRGSSSSFVNNGPKERSPPEEVFRRMRLDWLMILYTNPVNSNGVTCYCALLRGFKDWHNKLKIILWTNPIRMDINCVGHGVSSKKEKLESFVSWKCVKV